MFKQVIFDCDGVLVDTEIVAAKVVIDKLSAYDISITMEEYLKTYTGSTFSGTFRQLLPHISDHEIENLVNYAEVTVYDQLQPIKGMPDLVRQLNVPVAVVSNSYLWQVKKALEFLSLSNKVKQYFSAEQVERPKPFPDVYHLARQKTGYTAKEIIVVEDSKTGVEAAVSAGLTVIGFTGASHITNGHDQALKEKGATHIASSAHELLHLLDDLL